MRDYGRVTPTFWTRGSGKKLRGHPDAQLVALYLFTCPAATMIGLYHLALPTIAHEIGLPVERVREALAKIGAPDVDIARYDEEEELVYLPGGAKYQIGEQLKPKDKRVKGIQAAVAHFGSHPFAADFRQRYMGAVAPDESPTSDAPPDDEGASSDDEQNQEGASYPLPPEAEAPSKPGKARQGTSKEQAQEQASTHTLRGRAGAQGQGETMPMGCDRESFEDLLRSFAVLADLADDPDLVTDLHSGFGMAHLGAATLELARGALADVVSQKNLRDASQAQQRALVAKYLRNAKRPRAERASEPQTPAVRTVLEVFTAAWEARKKRDFVQADGDERHAAKLVDLAREHAEKLDVMPRVVVKHWAEAYLRDADKFVADPEHPLRLLPGRITGYGLPRSGAKAPAPVPVVPAEADSGARVGPPANFGDLLAGVGASNGDAIVRRPSFGGSS
jgi:hypothetical protein